MHHHTLPLYRHATGQHSVCTNVHNAHGQKGRSGVDNRFPILEPGQDVVIAEFDGPAVMDRLWLTFNWPGKGPYEQSMLRNRSVYLECYWDHATVPAVVAPVGDFFGHPLCYDMPFENALFADPSGRSFLSFVPMPFRKHARIRLVNEHHRPIAVYYDLRVRHGVMLEPEDGYFHACWRRLKPQRPGEEHEILPQVSGQGRYLGTHVGIITDPLNPFCWHVGQPKFYTDGDTQHPSMIGASLDDYCGSSWDYEKRYMHQDSGLLLSRTFPGGGGHFALYCYHRRDPFLFHQSCRVTLNAAAGASATDLLAQLQHQPDFSERIQLPFPMAELEKRARSGKPSWVNFERMDDLSTTALYYLDHPEGDHRLAAKEERCAPSWNWPVSNAGVLSLSTD